MVPNRLRLYAVRRRFLVLAAVALLGACWTFPSLASWPGVPINVYSSDPARRMQALAGESDDVRTIQQEWERAYFSAPQTSKNR